MRTTTWRASLTRIEQFTLGVVAMLSMGIGLVALLGGAPPLGKIAQLLRFGADTPIAQLYQLFSACCVMPGGPTLLR